MPFPMGPRALVAFLVTTFPSGCGGASLPPSETRVDAVHQEEASVDETLLPREFADHCVEVASRRAPLRPCIVRACALTFAERLKDLACCLSAEDYEGTIRVRFERVADTAEDQGHARLEMIRVMPLLSPSQTECVVRVVSTLRMHPGPQSDVLRTPLDPRRPPTFDRAAVGIISPFRVRGRGHEMDERE